MYSKYRLYLRTVRGTHVMGASSTVNDLVQQAKYWLTETAEGRSVYDEYDKQGRLVYTDVRGVILYQLEEKTGNYVFSEELPASSREDIITKIRLLGGR